MEREDGGRYEGDDAQTEYVQVEKDMGSRCFSKKVTERNFELEVGTPELSRCPVVICTRASHKAFRFSQPRWSLSPTSLGFPPLQPVSPCFPSQ